MKVLLATDGSEFSASAAQKCCEMLNIDHNTTVRIISVVEEISPVEPFGTSPEFYVLAQKASRDAAEAIVEDTEQMMRKALENATASIETQAISGKPGATIVEEAERWGADLIIVGSQGRGFWGRMLLGSVSNAVTQQAPCSVLVVRDQDLQAKFRD